MTRPTPRVAIIMRSFNDIDVIAATLAMVGKQTFQDFELWNFDSSSTDGTLDVIRRHNAAERILLNDSASYNPGRVLNEAVARVNAPLLVFLNSDATPCDEHWLERLVAPLENAGVGAVFGRQMPRPDCRELFAKDTERAFGDGREAAQWLHFFSMANAAVRAEVAAAYPFETRVQYSEDIEWSYRMRQDGYRIVYAADAAVIHSHNYTLRQSYRRHRGEGKAEAWIFRQGEIDRSFLRYCAMPLGMEILRDLKWAASHRSGDAALHSVPLRVAQKWGRWRGLRQGLREQDG